MNTKRMGKTKSKTYLKTEQKGRGGVGGGMD
jgi:hypothetical protein